MNSHDQGIRPTFNALKTSAVKADSLENRRKIKGCGSCVSVNVRMKKLKLPIHLHLARSRERQRRITV